MAETVHETIVFPKCTVRIRTRDPPPDNKLSPGYKEHSHKTDLDDLKAQLKALGINVS